MRILLIAALLIASVGTAQVNKGKLIWEENFDDQALNEAVWNFELGNGCPHICGWGNNERQHYTTENHRLEDGNLIITARKDGDRYTSTRITTASKKEFQYGYIEARAKLPVGHGIWPAFWMLGVDIKQVGWPMCGEIDILEYIGKEPGMVYTTLHYKDRHGDKANGKKTPMPAIEEGWHTYGVNWTKDKIEFFVDGKSVFSHSEKNKTQENWPFDQPFYILVNMAIGGNFGGPEVDDSIFPQEYVIDYIRVYSN